ncbi:DUF4124 domain-containing protein [Variovorax sp. RHLX14]|uniref:DUF4124 domain-containing protein n=1 Tax=Variovorax sp. RHLX14 TaxID=1259731 RepID=UPI003F4684C5
MRRSNLVAAAVTFASVAFAVASVGSPANAQVIRCTDAAGKISYTDKACPSNSRRSEPLEGMDTNGTTVGGSAPVKLVPTLPTVRSIEPVPSQPQPNGGLTIIDPRARDLVESERQARERSEREAADRTGAGLYPYPYGGYSGGYHRRAARPQDLRPTLRSCDAGGCNDTIGNHYDRAGKVDRYVRPDGRTCRPVGTTVVC